MDDWKLKASTVVRLRRPNDRSVIFYDWWWCRYCWWSDCVQSW